MKILFCAKHLVGRGGQEGFLRHLCDFLVKQGHELEILASASDPVPRAICTDVSVPKWMGRAAWDWAAARSVVAESRHHERDVSFGGQKMWGCNVIRPGGGVEAEYWNVRLSDRHKTPLMRALAKASSIKRRFDLDAEARAYNDPALRYVVVNSELVRDGVLRRFPTLGDKIRVIYNGADLDRFSVPANPDSRTNIHKELGLDPSRRTALLSGHNFRLKGLPQALAALEVANRKEQQGAEWQLIVIGGGRPSHVQRQIRKLDLVDSVRFVGNTSTPEQYYAASDVLLFPSFYDPCANVTFEALASGIPVISTKRNGASEVITDNREGWTVENPNCIAEMALHLNALEDTKRLSDMKAAARSLAEKHAITDKLADIEAVLKDASRLR